MIRAALYARVSTLDRGQDPELQLAELRQVAVQRGWTIAGEYVDHGVSGAETSRPSLDRLLADCHAGKLDLLLVWKLDRLGRSLAHLLAMLDALRTMGVAFVSLRDSGIDTTTPAGRLMLQMVGAFAEFERALTIERTNAGLQAARKRGVKFGRPFTLSGENIANAERLLALNIPPREVARTLKCGKSTLYRALKRTEGATTP